MSLFSRLFRGPGGRRRRQTSGAALAARRLAGPGLEAAYRSFVAGQLSRLTSTWSATPLSASEVIASQRQTLVARARDQHRNNDYVRAFVGLLHSNVIGPDGLELVPRPRFPDGSLDDLAARSISSAWRTWTAPGACDVAGRLSWIDFLRLYMTSLAIDGEVFVALHYGDHGPHGFALELLDSALIPADLNRRLAGGFEIRNGLELDPRGRTVAVYIRTKGDGDDVVQFNGRAFRRVSSARLIHDFVPTEVGQLRGLPWISTSLHRLRLLDGYLEAALVAARVGAAKMAFISSPDGEGFTGDDEDHDGAPTVTAEPGEFDRLRAGEEIHPWNPDYPRGEFSDFVKRCLQGISAGLGLQYSAIAKDHGDENYSSMMAGRLEDRDVYEALQRRTIERFVRPIFEAWLRVALTGGHITAGATTFPAARYERFREATFRGKRWRSIDPVKDANARRLEVDAGFRSRSDVIRDLGEDPDAVFDEIAREQQRLRELGVDVAPAGGVSIVAESNEEAQ